MPPCAGTAHSATASIAPTCSWLLLPRSRLNPPPPPALRSLSAADSAAAVLSNGRRLYEPRARSTSWISAGTDSFPRASASAGKAWARSGGEYGVSWPSACLSSSRPFCSEVADDVD
eukprot:6207250-Pleurochrysis_carterae.AAC.1